MDCSGNDCLPWITLEFFIILSLVKDFFIEKLKSSFVHHLQCHLKHCTSGFKMDLQRFRCCIKLMNKFTLFFSFFVWLINWKCHWRRKASTQKPEKSPTHTHTHTHTSVGGRRLRKPLPPPQYKKEPMRGSIRTPKGPRKQKYQNNPQTTPVIF